MPAEREEELQASPLTVYDPDVTAMELDGILYNRKTQAGSADIAGSAFFYTIKSLKNAFQMFLRNTFSCIIISKIAELLDRAVTFKMYSYIFSGILQAVFDQILKDSIHQGLVSGKDSTGT